MEFQHPFTMVIAGPTASGKTVLIEKFVSNINVMMYPKPEEIVMCYSIWQPAYDRLKAKKVVFYQGLPPELEGDVQIPRLIIIDDLMSETDSTVLDLFTKGSHHRNISVIQIVQNLFGKNTHQRTISLNCHYIALFKNPRDKAQIVHLGRQMYPGQTNFVVDAFKKATAAAWGYLLFDFKQQTPENLRLRTNIFPNELQTVFVPRNYRHV